MVEDEGLLVCWKMWSSPVSLHPLLPPSPSPPCTGLPQPQPTLSFPWLSWLWGQKHSDGDSTRKQPQLGLLFLKREDQKYSFRKEKARIQKSKKNYTNCLEESKIDIRPSPSLDLRETKGRISLPWAEGKAAQKSFRSPPSRVAPSRSALTDPTVNEHCYQVPGICFVYQKPGKRPRPPLRAASIVQRERSLLQAHQHSRGKPHRACLMLKMFTETLHDNGDTHPRFFGCTEILFMYIVF